MLISLQKSGAKFLIFAACGACSSSQSGIQSNLSRGVGFNPTDGNVSRKLDTSSNNQTSEVFSQENQIEASRLESMAKDLNFALTKSDLKILPFHVRFNRLKILTALSENHNAFKEILVNKYLLGEYNFSQKLFPMLSWNTSTQELWIKGLLSICKDPEVKARYGNDAEGALKLMAAALGRETDKAEKEALRDETKTFSPPQAFEIGCLASLSSLEFVGAP